MLRIGLTGGIACGKSHVLRGLARQGLLTLDLDDVAHQVLQRGGRAFDAVVAAFGAGILDGSGAIDRRVLGERVFHDEDARLRLNAIVHPQIRLEEDERARAAAARAALLVVDGALLVESGGHLRFDRLVVAHCRREQQIERLQRRDRLVRDEAVRRIETQMPLEEKQRFAGFTVDTAGGMDATDAQVMALASKLEALAGHRPRAAAISLERAVGCISNGPRRGAYGLSPAQVLSALTRAGALDLAELAELIEGSGGRAWYALATDTEDGSEGEAARLSAIAVLWVLAKRGLDREGAAAAAASLARLTHRAPRALAGACLMAGALTEIAESGRLSRGWQERDEAWRREAQKWGGAEAPGSVTAAIEAALREPSDVEAAQTECQGLGGDIGLCGALVGLCAGVALSDAEAAVVDACRALGF